MLFTNANVCAFYFPYIHNFCFQGAGTDNKILIEILSSRTNKQIKELSAAYAEGEMEMIRHFDDKIF